MAIVKNRRQYESINGKSYFGNLQPQRKYFGEARLSQERHEEHRTSWTDLKAIAFRDKEEQDLKMMLGIPIQKYVNREGGLGGGGNADIRRDFSLRKLENNHYSPNAGKLANARH
tara:strand:- start:2599 stop:2943 length:345 start_codon:yes stop_codon:yes gene_type:complete